MLTNRFQNNLLYNGWSAYTYTILVKTSLKNIIDLNHENNLMFMWCLLWTSTGHCLLVTMPRLLFVHMFVCLCFYVCVYISVCVYLPLFVCLYICLWVFMSVCVPPFLFVCLYVVCLCVCLFASLSVGVSLFDKYLHPIFSLLLIQSWFILHVI